MEEKDILPENPYTDISTTNPTLSDFLTWIKNETKATLFLDHMPKPKHGFLLFHNNEYYFRNGKHTSDPYTHLPDFLSTVRNLINTKQLFQGHPRYKPLIEGRINAYIAQLFAYHVSARGLSSEDVSTLLHHANLPPVDRKIWNKALKNTWVYMKSPPG